MGTDDSKRPRRRDEGAAEAEFLRRYRRGDYRVPSVTVDIVTMTVVDAELRVLLVRRGEHPFKGAWALPGGFVRVGDAHREQGEDLEAAAVRELEEETGLRPGDVYLEQLGAFGRAGRDPRMRVITVAYYALVRPDLVPLVRGGVRTPPPPKWGLSSLRPSEPTPSTTTTSPARGGRSCGRADRQDEHRGEPRARDVHRRRAPSPPRCRRGRAAGPRQLPPQVCADARGRCRRASAGQARHRVQARCGVPLQGAAKHEVEEAVKEESKSRSGARSSGARGVVGGGRVRRALLRTPCVPAAAHRRARAAEPPLALD